MTTSLRSVGLSIKRLQHRHHRAANAGLASVGLSLAQWDALRHLDENPTASLHALAVLTFQTDQAFGALASRMIDRGLITRVPGPGRAVHHELTARGRALRVAGNQVLDRVLAASLAALSASELATFAGLLAKVLAGPPAGRVSKRRRPSPARGG